MERRGLMHKLEKLARRNNDLIEEESKGQAEGKKTDLDAINEEREKIKTKKKSLLIDVMKVNNSLIEEKLKLKR